MRIKVHVICMYLCTYIYYDKKHRGDSTRATILPEAIILTKAYRATDSIYSSQGVYMGLSTLSSVFLNFTPQL